MLLVPLASSFTYTVLLAAVLVSVSRHVRPVPLSLHDELRETPLRKPSIEVFVVWIAELHAYANAKRFH